MRIAHISDLHVLALEGAIPFRLFNKRATGYANLRLRRGRHHQARLVRAIATHLSSLAVDHVVITGDLSNLALEAEFQAVRQILDDLLALSPSRVSIVPGNHDVYTRGAERSQRFYRYFDPYLRSDLPELRAEHPSGMFPVVKLRGPVAFIGLSTAVARLPFFASGWLGAPQRRALKSVLTSDDLKGAIPVILLHHPAVNMPAWTWTKRKMDGLDDAAELARILSDVPRGLLLHGHLHRRIYRRIPTRQGQIDMVGAASASLVHANPARMAGYNVYDIADDGTMRSLESYRYDEPTASFIAVDVPEETTGTRKQ
jgi:3',5'-cyclic AMP phosphodiesterase CpdA